MTVARPKQRMVGWRHDAQPVKGDMTQRRGTLRLLGVCGRGGCPRPTPGVSTHRGCFASPRSRPMLRLTITHVSDAGTGTAAGQRQRNGGIRPSGGESVTTPRRRWRRRWRARRTARVWSGDGYRWRCSLRPIADTVGLTLVRARWRANSAPRDLTAMWSDDLGAAEFPVRTAVVSPEQRLLHSHRASEWEATEWAVIRGSVRPHSDSAA